MASGFPVFFGSVGTYLQCERRFSSRVGLRVIDLLCGVHLEFFFLLLGFYLGFDKIALRKSEKIARTENLAQWT